MPKTMDLIELVVQFAVFVESRFKHEFNCWRPVDFSTQVQPTITTPGHGSFPSGHCTQSYVTARVLASLVAVATGSARDVQMQRLAARIATNRVIAGVHFPVDNLVGRLLGETLAEYALARFTPTKSWQPRFFDGAVSKLADESFDPEAQPLAGGAGAPYYSVFGGGQSQTYAKPSSILSEMWQAARDECQYLRP